MKKEQAVDHETVETPVEPFPDYTAVRESKGIDLKNLANATKIRLSYLEAIEKGNFEMLPESIYAETFIKTYARELGEDADVLLAHYRRHLGRTAPLSQESAANKPKVEWLKEKKSRSGFSFRAAGWVFSGLVVIVFMISFFSTYTADNGKPDNVKLPPQPEKADILAPAADQPAVPGAGGEGAPAASAAAPVKAVPERTHYKLVIEATETSWLNILEDDNPPFEVLLRPGERIKREATDRFSIDIGNAGGVVVYFQGKSLGPLGKSGQVVHLNLPEENRNQ